MSEQGAEGARAQGAEGLRSVVRSYQDLLVRQKSFRLSIDVYRLTRGFPDDERFGLRSQLRRAAVSIPSNIAEGYSRGTTRDYIRFLWMSNGSLAELETQLLIVRELGLAETGTLDSARAALSEIARMLKALIRALDRRKTK